MNNIFAVITLWQPWATWIMREWKTIETRTHDRFKSLKGQTVLIHAGAYTDSSAAVIYNAFLTKEQILFNPDEVINGHILGSAFVEDFKLLNFSHAKKALIECTTTRYGLFLKDIDKWKTPIPAKGEQGIWYYDMDAKVKIRKPEPHTPNLFS